ncbi:MAG TPA: DUF6541 family protein [Chloroflexia bacterium]|nr:DUF6541 family protein [Chloroflexia bacterium]
MPINNLATWLPLLLAGGGLFLLPGLALRAALAAAAGRRDPTLGAPDGPLGALLDSLGLSLAAWPLGLLFASLLHVPVTRLTTGAALALCGVVWMVLLLRARRARGQRVTGATLGRLALHPLTLLTAGALVVRFLDVNGLAVPNWGDSFHHTLITQLFLEQRGVPHGYTPYAPVYSFTYHFGFHGLAALWAWLTEQTAWAAVLSVGQVLNALAVPAAYVLTRELFRSRVAALASAVVVGFLSSMPAEYANWGRYTQLAGQVLLPFALVWFLRWVEAPPTARFYRTGWPRLALAAVGAAGLGLTHYRVLIFYALFVAAYLGARSLASVQRRKSRAGWGSVGLQSLLGRTLAVGAAGGLLFAPWLGNLLADYLPGLFGRLGRVTSTYVNEYAAQAFLTQFIGVALPVLAVVGIALALWRGPARARLMAGVVVAWTILLTIAARPDALGLPGVGAIGTFTIGIALYLPLGALAGPGVGRPLLWVLLQARRRWGSPPSLARPLRAVPASGALLAALLLTLRNPGALTPDPRYAYVTPDDLGVLTWARAATPPGAHFLISGASTYSGQAITATDAGMWLPLLTGGDRTASIPPLSAGSEGKQAQDLAARTRALYRASISPTVPSNVDLLHREHINYVFLGEQTPTISPTLLLQDTADYCLLYQHGDSYLFGLRAAEATCPAR